MGKVEHRPDEKGIALGLLRSHQAHLAAILEREAKDGCDEVEGDWDGQQQPGQDEEVMIALQDEEEIEMDAEENLPSMGGGQGNWMPGMEQGGRARTPPKRKQRRRPRE